MQYGPNAVQWCTTGLLEAIAEASAGTGRRVHMHLLETRYQRAWADAEFPGGIVRYLDRIGLLSPRLTLAHCTWARPDELELIAERGAPRNTPPVIAFPMPHVNAISSWGVDGKGAVSHVYA